MVHRSTFGDNSPVPPQLLRVPVDPIRAARAGALIASLALGRHNYGR